MIEQTPFRSQCTCPCHTHPGMLHFRACCAPDPVEQVTVCLTDKRLAEARKIAERLKGMMSPLEVTDRVLSIRRDLNFLLDILNLSEK